MSSLTSLYQYIVLLFYVGSYVSANYKRVCYFTNWAQYRDGAGKYFAKDLDPFLCTHVIYAFAKVSGNSIEPYEWNDINQWGKGGYEMARDLKIANPDLQLLLAIGGWNHGSEPFTAMVSTQSNIDQFANNTVIFLRANGFDGLDLDWEYPANRGSPPEDKIRFTSLIQTLRNTFDADVLKTGRSQLLLTAAVSAGKSTIDTAYEIDKISLYLDFINLMAYDFNGGTSQTGHNSPLYNSGPPNPDFNTDFAVNLWLKGGAPKHKLIVGLATYGRSYTLQSTTNTGLGAPASGPGTAGTFTRESGFLAYYEICSFIANNGWTEVWLDGQQVPYAYKGNQWVGYDNLRSIEVKTNYIIDKGLGGAMVWAVDLDDFHGNCNQGNNPLMNKIRSVLNGTSGPDITIPTRPPVVSTSMNTVSAVSANYKRVCYFTNWAQYRDGAGKYFAKDLDPFLCTHVIYAFAKVSGNSIEPYEWNDINQWGKGGYEMARDLKIANPDLQLLLAIGGWNHGSEPFTAMVSTQSNIGQFANNTVIFLRANGFDGLDLDWEYPANRGSPPEDKIRFTSLIQTLRNTFDADVLKTGRSQLLLTAAVSAGKSTIDTAYEIDKISLYLDFINLMAYDFNGGTSQTGHNSPLYNSGPPNPDFNTDFAVNLWLKGGAPKHKLIVGLATYGRSYTLQSTTNTGLGAPASGPGTAGTFTRESGFLAYYEICSFIANNGWTEVWLDGQQVPYAYKGNQWVGYDNLRSIEVKTNYIIDKGLGGAMVWAVDLDDFHGNCNQGNNPLMNKIRSVLNGTSGPNITIPTRPPVVSTSMNTVSAVSANYKRVCYFTNWAQYRDGAGKYFAKDVDPFLCTHVIYAFAKVSGNSIEPYEWNDINEWGKGGYEMARDLKKANPDLRLLLAIGGWNHGSEPFTAMVSTQSNIDQFAYNTVIFLRANGFDGLDLDWEYPANRGSPPEDKKRFTSLIQTLRNTFDADVLKTGRSQLLLTAAVSAGKSTVDTAYEIDKIAMYLDFINLMAYDFNGGTSQTGHNSPLYNSGPPNPDFNTDYAVNLWLKGGAPRHKLIVGLATYGRSYTLQSTTNTGLGAPASGPGTAGTFTRESGFLAYYEICSFIVNNGWTEVWLDGQQVPYAYKGNQWVGYDNLRSIEVKANYIINKGLGGAMIWAVDLDDFHGNCGQGNNPLMNKIRSVLNGASGPDIPLTSRPPVVSTSMNTVSAGLQNDCERSVNTVGVGLGVSLVIVIATNVALVFYILSLKGCKLLPACASKNIGKLKFHIDNQGILYTDMIKTKETKESSVTGEFTSSERLCKDNLTFCLENEEQPRSIQINSKCDATNPSNENSEYDIVIAPFQSSEPYALVQKDLKLSSSTVA